MSAASSHLADRCWAEINLRALRENAAAVRHRSGAELMAIVKENAYGHGAVEVARTLQNEVAMLGVANLHEAEALRAGGVSTPVLLLGTLLPAERDVSQALGFQICISSMDEAVAWNELGARRGGRVQAHVVVDTGMGRMGFPQETWSAGLVRELTALQHIDWAGIASHLPSADEDRAFTAQQIARFRMAVETARAGGLTPRWIHLANSAGLLGYEEPRDFCNLGRPGLALYGVSPLAETGSLLHPVLAWKTRVTLVRELQAGHGVSYGRSAILSRTTRVATLACGYADGYPRQVSGHGASVLIGGRRCPLLGRVTMDQIMVDVTDLPQAVVAGDEAVLLGCQGGETISADEIARWAGTISWHIFTGITARVLRSYDDAV